LCTWKQVNVRILLLKLNKNYGGARQGGDTFGREWDSSTNKSELFPLKVELKKRQMHCKYIF
jgi:hypothetical protein